jgi:transposase
MYVRKKLQKRRSSIETKLYAVQQVKELNRSKRVVAEEIGYSVNSVIAWVKIFDSHGEAGLRTKKSHLQPNDRSELERLRFIEKKYYQQQVEIEILKKFQAFLKGNENKRFMKP